MSYINAPAFGFHQSLDENLRKKMHQNFVGAKSEFDTFTPVLSSHET